MAFMTAPGVFAQMIVAVHSTSLVWRGLPLAPMTPEAPAPSLAARSPSSEKSRMWSLV
jgi:hypothetical protein